MSCLTENCIFIYGSEAELLAFSETFMANLNAVIETAELIIPERTVGDTVIDVVIDGGTTVKIDVPVHNTDDSETMKPHIRRLGYYSEMSHGFDAQKFYFITTLCNYYVMNGEALVLSQLYPNLEFIFYYNYEQSQKRHLNLFIGGNLMEEFTMDIVRSFDGEGEKRIRKTDFEIHHGADLSEPSNRFALQIAGIDGHIIWTSDWACDWIRKHSSESPESSDVES